MAVNKSTKKGADTEESLRSYFNSSGFFSVRGVPFEHAGISLTDIDLWIYIRESNFARIRINVDIKNKRTPQAMERIFWTKGLQTILNLDDCIVATTSNKSEVVEFGKMHGVTVLNGTFLKRVSAYNALKDQRLTEEEFRGEIEGKLVIDPSMNGIKVYEGVKKTLLTSFNFDGCNKQLKTIEIFIQELLCIENNKEGALRCLYILIAFFLITLDFALKNYSYLEYEERTKAIFEGLSYGDSGKKRVDNITDIAVQLVDHATNGDDSIKETIESEIKRQLNEYPAGVLAEFFAQTSNMVTIFDDAKDFEYLAYASEIVEIRNLEVNKKRVIGVVCDFFGIDRKLIL